MIAVTTLPFALTPVSFLKMPRSSLPQKETFLFQIPSVTTSFLCRCPATCPRAAAGSSGSPGFPVPAAHLCARTEPPRPELWGISDSTPPTLPTSSKGTKTAPNRVKTPLASCALLRNWGISAVTPAPKRGHPTRRPLHRGPAVRAPPNPPQPNSLALRPSLPPRHGRLPCPSFAVSFITPDLKPKGRFTRISAFPLNLCHLIFMKNLYFFQGSNNTQIHRHINTTERVP